MMEYKVYYNGQETSDFDTLAGWFQEVYCKMLSLKEANKQLREANEQYRDDMNQVRNLNKSLENEITELKVEKRKTNEVLKKYCGDSVDAPIPTMVGFIVDDYFYQKAEAECQVKELQKAEKTIDKLNKELVEYADKVEELENELEIEELEKEVVKDEKIVELEEKIEELEKMRWLPDWCQVIDKLDEIIDEEAPERRPSCLYLGRVEEIMDKVSRIKNAIHGRNQVLDQRKATIDRLRKENEKLILVQGDSEIEYAVEITDLKKEISALKKELEEHKNKRSPRWPSDVMRIEKQRNDIFKLTKENEELRIKNKEYSRVAHDALDAGYGATGTIHNLEIENSKLKNDIDKLTEENKMLKYFYSPPWMYGMNSKEVANRIFGVNGTIHKLREENNKLKDALEFCQKEASKAREHSHNVEVNAERTRLEID